MASNGTVEIKLRWWFVPCALVVFTLCRLLPIRWQLKVAERVVRILVKPAVVVTYPDGRKQQAKLNTEKLVQVKGK